MNKVAISYIEEAANNTKNVNPNAAYWMYRYYHNLTGNSSRNKDMQTYKQQQALTYLITAFNLFHPDSEEDLMNTNRTLYTSLKSEREARNQDQESPHDLTQKKDQATGEQPENQIEQPVVQRLIRRSPTTTITK